jgi:hypothetical protein
MLQDSNRQQRHCQNLNLAAFHVDCLHVLMSAPFVSASKEDSTTRFSHSPLISTLLVPKVSSELFSQKHSNSVLSGCGRILTAPQSTSQISHVLMFQTRKKNILERKVNL